MKRCFWNHCNFETGRQWDYHHETNFFADYISLTLQPLQRLRHNFLWLLTPPYFHTIRGYWPPSLIWDPCQVQWFWDDNGDVKKWMFCKKNSSTLLDFNKTFGEFILNNECRCFRSVICSDFWFKTTTFLLTSLLEHVFVMLISKYYSF